MILRLTILSKSSSCYRPLFEQARGNERIVRILVSICGLLLCALSAAASNLQRHVVVVVWDGMRPDFVTEQNAPVLSKLAREGALFRNHHAVYLSATNVNGVALATGMYPNHAGLIANHEFRQAIDGRKPVDVENPTVVRKGDELSHGNYITAPTVADLVQKSGGSTIIAASKTVGLLHDRQLASMPVKDAITLSAGTVWPNDVNRSIVALLGKFPKLHAEQGNWTTKALTEVLWKDGVPSFSVLWLGEPDLTQHETAPGTEAALSAIRSSDNNLAAVLAALDRHQMRQATDVFVVSDHGFSTIERKVDLPKILAAAGFEVLTEFKTKPKTGDIMMVGGGGSVLFYVIDHEPATVRRLVEFLQQSDFASVVFTKSAMEGTFALEKAQIDSADAPDVVVSFRWNDSKNQFGVPGMIYGDWQRGAGKGTHATLSRFDMHNTLVAAGPDFRRGFADDLPSGNVDVAPTILHIFGIAAPRKQDGRVLSEAFLNPGDEVSRAEVETIEATREFSPGTWHQSMQLSRVGTTLYIDEGNGSFEGKK
jgi:predicted AlkP superfamily pyrophosphatase or phosphodiesterase